MAEYNAQSAVFTDYDSFLFHQGTNYEVYRKLGAHPGEAQGVQGTWFNVWAPNAQYVSVITARTGWENEQWMHRAAGDSGVWECFLAGVGQGDAYRYVITGADGVKRYKSDPYGFWTERRPQNASIVWGLDNYEWHDEIHQAQRDNTKVVERPMSIYEVHLGSWKKGFQGDWDEDGFLNYTQLADDLVNYVTYMGFTHVELMGICEHPFDLSWGYQTTGYYAPTSRYGTPDDFRYFVDRMHQAGIGVILDWVPAHYPKDAHGLYHFDGGPTYESADWRRAENESWGTAMFDFGRNEVRSFLKSSAVFWLEMFHADGLRVDAVSYMLYHDYCKEPGKWIPNKDGGRENYEAISLFHEINTIAYRDFPGIMISAEEATAYPKVTAPIHDGGLGFGYKWNMGWMHDVLDYMELDPIYRKYHHNKMTFSMMYAFSENYVLPFSHDEVVHGKKSMLDKMPGDIWQKFAGLRALLGYQYAHPGKKLLFMGAEFGQFIEWKELEQLDWLLLDYKMHPEMQNFTKKLNAFYKSNTTLYRVDDSWDGFTWCYADDADRSIFSFIRSDDAGNKLLCIFNFTPAFYGNYRVGIPKAGLVTEVFNSDSVEFGGSGKGNMGATKRTENLPCQNQPYSIELCVPPLSCMYFKFEPYKGAHPRKHVKRQVDVEK